MNEEYMENQDVETEPDDLEVEGAEKSATDEEDDEEDVEEEDK